MVKAQGEARGSCGAVGVGVRKRNVVERGTFFQVHDWHAPLTIWQLRALVRQLATHSHWETGIMERNLDSAVNALQLAAILRQTIGNVGDDTHLDKVAHHGRATQQHHRK